MLTETECILLSSFNQDLKKPIIIFSILDDGAKLKTNISSIIVKKLS